MFQKGVLSFFTIFAQIHHLGRSHDVRLAIITPFLSFHRARLHLHLARGILIIAQSPSPDRFDFVQKSLPEYMSLGVDPRAELDCFSPDRMRKRKYSSKRGVLR